ncbi:MAG TPA: AI-2E family transporter [Anaerolineae bacterium]|nr:AI-2E family transporter [Anaerolineae bacterium]HMR63627.1 AI-2E family transporter [Anaerolineae bacterium]
MRKLLWSVTIVMATLATVFVLWQFRSAAWLFLFSLVAAATFRPYIQFFNQQGYSWQVALFFGYGLILTGMGVLAAIFGYFLIVELQQLSNDLAIGYEHILVVWPEGTMLQQAVANRLPPSATVYESLLGREDASIIQTLTGVTSSLTEMIAYVVIVIVLSIYWAADQVRFERLWLSLIPIEYRARARAIWREVETNVGNYTRSELIQSLTAALLLGFGYWLLGLEYPALLALIGAVAWLVPIIGATLALIAVALVAIAYSPVIVWLAMVYTLLIFWLLEWMIEPRFFNRKRFSSLLLVILMIAFIDSLGLLGLLIAPPLAVAIQILFNQLIQERFSVATGETVPTLAELQERVAQLDELLAAQEMPASPKTLDLVDRLKNLLAETAQLPDTPVAEPKKDASRPNEPGSKIEGSPAPKALPH